MIDAFQARETFIRVIGRHEVLQMNEGILPLFI